MIYNIEPFEYILKSTKRIKKPLVKIYPDGFVIGTDTSFATINILSQNNNNYNMSIPYIFMNTSVLKFSKDILDYNGSLNYSKFNISIKDVVLDNCIELNYRFSLLHDTVMSLTSNPVLYKEENIQNSISDMFMLKMADGSKMYTINKRFLMTSFNSIHPVNKSDRVDLTIFDGDIYSYIAQFTIYKEKENYELHEFLRFRKI